MIASNCINHFNKTKKNNNNYILLVITIALLYSISCAILPFVSNSNNKKNYTNFANHVLFVNKKINFTTNNTTDVTYINTDEFIARQLNNDNLQTYISDAKGSVLKLNDADDTTNNHAYSYNAYGNIVPASSKSSSVSLSQKRESISLNIPNSLQYNGERSDSNTLLQYLRARFYSPETKRFINQDTYQLLNKSGYVDANPVMNVDPEGNMSWNDFWGNVGHGLAVAANTIGNAFSTAWNSDVGRNVIIGVSSAIGTGILGFVIGSVASGMRKGYKLGANITTNHETTINLIDLDGALFFKEKHRARILLALGLQPSLTHKAFEDFSYYQDILKEAGYVSIQLMNRNKTVDVLVNMKFIEKLRENGSLNIIVSTGHWDLDQIQKEMKEFSFKINIAGGHIGGLYAGKGALISGLRRQLAFQHNVTYNFYDDKTKQIRLFRLFNWDCKYYHSTIDSQGKSSLNFNTGQN